MILKPKNAWLKQQPKEFSDSDLASFIRWLERNQLNFTGGADRAALLLKALKREKATRKGPTA